MGALENKRVITNTALIINFHVSIFCNATGRAGALDAPKPSGRRASTANAPAAPFCSLTPPRTFVQKTKTSGQLPAALAKRLKCPGLLGINLLPRKVASGSDVIP